MQISFYPTSLKQSNEGTLPKNIYIYIFSFFYYLFCFYHLLLFCFYHLLLLFVFPDWRVGTDKCRLLCDLKITDHDTLFKALDKLHQQYSVRHIVITSLNFEENPDYIVSVASTTGPDGEFNVIKAEIPVIPLHFNGTGDLLASLIAVNFYEQRKKLQCKSSMEQDDCKVSATEKLPLAYALEKAVNSVYAILLDTHKASIRIKNIEQGKGLASDNISESRQTELRLVQNAEAIIHPPIIIHVKPLSTAR